MMPPQNHPVSRSCKSGEFLTDSGINEWVEVFDPSIEEDAEAGLLWIGTALQSSPRSPRSRPSTPAGPRSHTTSRTTSPRSADRQPPTPLQHWAHQLLYDAGDAPPRPCLTPSRVQPCAPLGLGLHLSIAIGGFFYGYRTDRTTPYQVITDRTGPDGEGHRALASALDSATGLPATSSAAGIPGHQRVASRPWAMPSPSGRRSTRSNAGGTSAKANTASLWCSGRSMTATKPRDAASREGLVLRQYTVFNAVQLDGIPSRT